MHTRRKLLLVLFASIAATVGLTALLASQQEQRLQGRPLSEWVDMAGSNDAEGEHGRAVIRAIGTNTLPTIVRWISRHNAHWRWRRKLLRAFPRSARNTPLVMSLSGITDANNVIRAVNAFYLLGTNAAPAIPALVALSKNTNYPTTAFYAINALSLLGRPAFPHMVAALDNTNRPYRRDFVRNFSNLAASVGTNVCQARLLAVLSDPDLSVRDEAALGLLEIRCETNAPVIK